jgi:hypothetical protein
MAPKRKCKMASLYRTSILLVSCVSLCNEGSVEDLVPRVRHAGEAPVAAVVARVAASVGRRVAVPPELRQQRDVEQVHRLRHAAERRPHCALRWRRPRRVRRPRNRLRLLGAVLAAFAPFGSAASNECVSAMGWASVTCVFLGL